MTPRTAHSLSCLRTVIYYDGEYAAFGRITSGLINCDNISRVEVDGTTPVEPQTIREINILGN